MTSVLHPVGPEPEETYWRRRALVLGAAVLLVVLVITLFVNGSGTGSAVSATPSPVPLSPAPPSLTAATPVLASGTPSPGPYDDTATPGVTPPAGGSASPSPSGTPSASETPSASPSADASELPSASPAPSASPSPKPKPKPAGPVTCSPTEVRTTLTGKQQVSAEQPTSFRLSVINGSSAPCVVKVGPSNFTLTIYSGVDRIWSSADCASAVKPVSAKVAPEAAAAWSMAWNGRRSASECEVRPEIPRPGTYVATAQLRGAAPVQLRFVLTG